MKVGVFFECKPSHILPHNQVALYDDQDIIPLDILHNCFVIYQDDDKSIVQYRADNLTIQELAIQAEYDDPLSLIAVENLGISSKYLGRSLDDVFVKYPNLAGKRSIETEDGELEVDIVRRIF